MEGITVAMDYDNAIKFCIEEIKSLHLAPALNGCEMTQEWADRYEAALDALKRQKESASGCEYCQGDECSPLSWKYGLDHIFPDYKFCPMCGRKIDE